MNRKRFDGFVFTTRRTRSPSNISSVHVSWHRSNSWAGIRTVPRVPLGGAQTRPDVFRLLPAARMENITCARFSIWKPTTRLNSPTDLVQKTSDTRDTDIRKNGYKRHKSSSQQRKLVQISSVITGTIYERQHFAVPK